MAPFSSSPATLAYQAMMGKRTLILRFCFIGTLEGVEKRVRYLRKESKRQYRAFMVGPFGDVQCWAVYEVLGKMDI